jgi:hypothetical protein
VWSISLLASAGKGTIWRDLVTFEMVFPILPRRVNSWCNRLSQSFPVIALIFRCPIIEIFGEAGCVVLPSQILNVWQVPHTRLSVLALTLSPPKASHHLRWSCISRAGPDAPLLGGSTPSGFPFHQQSTGRCHRHLDHEFRVPVATSQRIMREVWGVGIKMMGIVHNILESDIISIS